MPSTQILLINSKFHEGVSVWESLGISEGRLGNLPVTQELAAASASSSSATSVVPAGAGDDASGADAVAVVEPADADASGAGEDTSAKSKGGKSPRGKKKGGDKGKGEGGDKVVVVSKAGGKEAFSAFFESVLGLAMGDWPKPRPEPAKPDDAAAKEIGGEAAEVEEEKEGASSAKEGQEEESGEGGDAMEEEEEGAEEEEEAEEESGEKEGGGKESSEAPAEADKEEGVEAPPAKVARKVRLSISDPACGSFVTRVCHDFLGPMECSPVCRRKMPQCKVLFRYHAPHGAELASVSDKMAQRMRNGPLCRKRPLRRSISDDYGHEFVVQEHLRRLSTPIDPSR